MLIVVFLFFLQNISVDNGVCQKLNFTVAKTFTNNIFLYYYKGPKATDIIALKLEDGLNLTKLPDFDVTKQTVFHYPGYGETATNGSGGTIGQAFLKAKIRNYVVFDYAKLVTSKYVITNYVISVVNATYIGQAIGEFFKAYIPKGQPINLIRMTSHSLGSQIMAKVARVYGIGKFLHLTALDPAGPLYNIPGIDHLVAKDGKFVEVIHTDGGIFGDGRTLGTVDFFPNKGTRVQPGCGSALAIPNSDACSHARSYEYYAQTILHPKLFVAKPCHRDLLFNFCCCNNKTIAYMGYWVSTKTNGTYYLNTNSTSPYGEGLKGLNFT